MSDAILSTIPLGFVWQTPDPFLFCVHHRDDYPPGNENLGPAAPLTDRNLGNDFEGQDGWRMYHGQAVPGFPQHPHRGFETVTLVRRGFIDHSDSLGAVARFGRGDAQWLTAGRGIVHSEMFPLLDSQKSNPLELFQIWLNLPAAAKMADPYFTMLWNRDIPKLAAPDADGRITEVTVVAGRYRAAQAPPPPPHSWAARADADVAIWGLRMEPGAQWTLPAAAPGSNRTLYFFQGGSLSIASLDLKAGTGIVLRPESEARLENGGAASELLLLQGRPIGEPVAQYGPFVMNSRAEIEQAFRDYQRTRFGGWPWPSDEPVHARGEGRFARHADGRLERKDNPSFDV